MLYGKREVQDEILKKVYEFEQKYEKQVVFGAVVGSISKGEERYDSDYDTRFLYLDKSDTGYLRWDWLKADIKESQIHQSFIPENKDLFYDKIAFWELTSFINFLRKPQLDGKFSVGLYHIVGWTFNSPYTWDPYGIKSKIIFLIDAMFHKGYEITYYRNYILKCLQKDKCLLREYLYSSYYAIAIQYCIKYNRFAPVYFKTIEVLCIEDEFRIEIEKLKEKYYETAKEITQKNEMFYKRKMTNLIEFHRNKIIDAYLTNVLESTKEYETFQMSCVAEDYVEDIISVILDSLKRPMVKDVNDNV